MRAVSTKLPEGIWHAEIHSLSSILWTALDRSLPFSLTATNRDHAQLRSGLAVLDDLNHTQGFICVPIVTTDELTSVIKTKI
jgi:hypothetical protein